MTLDDLKNIDVNNLGSWPVPIKIVGILLVCGVILFAGYWFLIKGELEEYGEAQKKEVSLRETYMNKKALAINLPAYREQMEEWSRPSAACCGSCPTPRRFPICWWTSPRPGWAAAWSSRCSGRKRSSPGLLRRIADQCPGARQLS
jgi:hypothetical protein